MHSDCLMHSEGQIYFKKLLKFVKTECDAVEDSF